MSSDTPGDIGEEAWYAQWFGEEYLQLYPHRDEAEAQRATELVLSHVRLEEGSRALDLACGAGRHLARMQQRGLRAVGLDLSLPLLERAREDRLPVVRGDMRALPFRRGTFMLLTNFFTSFGYFASRQDDAQVLTEVRRVLRPGGYFALDFLNANRVRAELRPHDERVVNGRRIVERRSLVEEGTVVEKRIEIHDPANRFPRTFYERVRLYGAGDLEELLDRYGLITEYRLGDYTGAPLQEESPRVIYIGRSR